MRRIIFVLCLALSVPAFAKTRVSGFCEQGGTSVSIGTFGPSPTKVQASFPGCTVSVFATGTVSPPSTLYSDNIGTVKANPFTASATDGSWFFYVDDGRYDIQLSGAGLTTYSIADVSVGLASGTAFAQSYLCIKGSAATTWTCPHNFGNASVIVEAFDSNGKLIWPDSVTQTDVNTATLTFTVAQAGSAIVMRAGTMTLAQDLQSVIVANPTTNQTIQGGYSFTNTGPIAGTSITGSDLTLSGGPWIDARAYGSGDICQHVAAAAAVIQASSAPGGVIDARAMAGAQPCSIAPFTGINKPITLLTGPGTWSWDISAFNFELPPHLHVISQGTTFRNSVNGAGGATLTIMGRVMNTGGVFIPRVYSTTGSITTGTNTLTVASSTGIEPGTVVAVWGAQGGTTQQTTTISNGGSSITSGATTIPLASMTGLPNTTLMVFQIDSELVKCTTATAGTLMTGCTRGYAGTTAASHADGATVKDVLLFITDVLSVSGNTLTLLDSASFTVTNADVAYGSTGIILEGDLTIDGNQNRVAGPNNGITVSGLNAIFASNMYVAPSVLFYNNNHGGAMINCSRHNYISGKFQSNGRPASGLGSDVWLLEQSSYNTVITTSHSDGDYVVLIDDRSDSSNLCDGNSSNNTVKVGPVLGTYVFGVGIEGSSNNRVDIGSLSASNTGAYITAAQWTANPTPTRNLITFAMLNGTVAGVSSSGYTGGNNAFIGGATTGGANTFVAGDSFLGGGTIVSTLDGLKLFRSGGNAGFPDVFGDGTHALVIGGKSDGSGQVSAGTTSDVLVPSIKSTTGVRYVCVDTSGKLVSQAAACSGT